MLTCQDPTPQLRSQSPPTCLRQIPMALLVCATTALLGYTLNAPLTTPRAVAATSSRASIYATENTNVGRRQAAQLASLGVTSMAFSPLAANADGYPQLKITTTEGVMEFDLWDDVAPKHVESMLKLAKQGFFDGGAFHRIIPGFVIQGGDPNAKVGYGADGTLAAGDKGLQRKWGLGGPGYNVPAEFNSRLHEFGVLSMARSQDVNSAGSQFFVCLGRLTSLDQKYTVFGKITKGEDVLKRIAAAQTNERDVPLKRQGIERIDGV